MCHGSDICSMCYKNLKFPYKYLKSNFQISFFEEMNIIMPTDYDFGCYMCEMRNKCCGFRICGIVDMITLLSVCYICGIGDVSHHMYYICGI